MKNQFVAKLKRLKKKYIVWSKMIRNCHHIREEKLQKNRYQCHFVAQSILDKR